MTQITVITFGTADFSWAVETQRRRSLKFGAHRHVAYGIDSAPVLNARSENPLQAATARGYGLWIWKPYILLDALGQCSEGDHVIYLDAGVAPVADLAPWFAQLQRRPIGLFAPVPPRPALAWTKSGCFHRMSVNAPRFHETPMLSGGIQAYCNEPGSRDFLAELKSLMQDPLLLTDARGPEDAQENPEFIAHRHDQSILTLLALARGHSIFREPSQYGIWTRAALDAYLKSKTINPDLLNEECPQVLDVHRGRNRSPAVVQQLWRIRRKLAGARHGVVCV